MLTKEDVSTVFEKVSSKQASIHPADIMDTSERIMSYPEFFQEYGRYIYDDHTSVSTSSDPFSNKSV